MLFVSDFNQKESAWSKAYMLAIPHHIYGGDPNVIRMDRFGYYILYWAYGDRTSDFGWEVDHIYPLSLGGPDESSNAEALHWRANVRKSDNVYGLSETMGSAPFPFSFQPPMSSFGTSGGIQMNSLNTGADVK
jgi:HNH endonuclease